MAREFTISEFQVALRAIFFPPSTVLFHKYHFHYNLAARHKTAWMAVFSACQLWSEMKMSKDMHAIDNSPYNCSQIEQRARENFCELICLGIGINETKVRVICVIYTHETAYYKRKYFLVYFICIAHRRCVR